MKHIQFECFTLETIECNAKTNHVGDAAGITYKINMQQQMLLDMGFDSIDYSVFGVGLGGHNS